MFEISIIETSFYEMIQNEFYCCFRRHIILSQFVQAVLFECIVCWNKECIICTRYIRGDLSIVQKSMKMKNILFVKRKGKFHSKSSQKSFSQVYTDLVIIVTLGSLSNAKNEWDKNCAPNHGNAKSGGVSLSLCIWNVNDIKFVWKKKCKTKILEKRV